MSCVEVCGWNYTLTMGGRTRRTRRTRLRYYFKNGCNRATLRFLWSLEYRRNIVLLLGKFSVWLTSADVSLIDMRAECTCSGGVVQTQARSLSLIKLDTTLFHSQVAWICCNHSRILHIAYNEIFPLLNESFLHEICRFLKIVLQPFVCVYLCDHCIMRIYSCSTRRPIRSLFILLQLVRTFLVFRTK